MRTSPVTVIHDYGRVMRLAGYDKFLPKENLTILKLNLSWTLFYPACSTPPWQLEGVLKTLRDDGYQNILAVENQTVVTHPWKGAYYNKWLPILKKYGVKFQPLTDVEWTDYRPKAEVSAMVETFGKILVPRLFMGSNIIHLPTMKTHGHTTTTGAMKNAFGGLIPKYRHHAHMKIHEILVDLLAIQKEVHQGIFAVTDGCVCGDGAGPRTMRPFIGNVILSGSDQVAIDAVSARIMGFDPFSIEYIKMAHAKGLGCGDISRIDIEGLNKTEFEGLNFKFRVKKSPVIRWDQILRKGTADMKYLQRILFHSPVFKIFIFMSGFYHDRLWYPFIGRRKIDRFKDTDWGKLFNKYECGEFPHYEIRKDWDPY
jgi:uncharacterized protein (DUF362 family)